MKKPQEINKAREILELPETATLAEIKSNYRKLLSRWHPDKFPEKCDQCNEITQSIIVAYQIIIDYCSNYRFSFKEEAIRENLTPEEWWDDRFGDDPLWGKKKQKTEISINLIINFGGIKMVKLALFHSGNPG